MIPTPAHSAMEERDPYLRYFLWPELAALQSDVDQTQNRSWSWRNERLDIYQSRNRLRSRNELYRHLGLSEAQVLAVIREEGAAFSRDAQTKLLSALAISTDVWNRAR